MLVPASIQAIELVEECGVDDVQFVRADADNRAWGQVKSDKSKTTCSG